MSPVIPSRRQTPLVPHTRSNRGSTNHFWLLCALVLLAGVVIWQVSLLMTRLHEDASSSLPPVPAIPPASAGIPALPTGVPVPAEVAQADAPSPEQAEPPSPAPGHAELNEHLPTIVAAQTKRLQAKERENASLPEEQRRPLAPDAAGIQAVQQENVILQ